MFSATVSDGKMRASWNDRPEARAAARWSAPQSVTSTPWSHDAPAVERQEARDEVEDRRLAGAVRADEPEDLAVARA